MTDSKIAGSCLCGAISFEVSQLERITANCHCSMCRKFHGAAFATFGVAKASDFTWLKGEDSLNSFEAANGTIRKFCGECGSSLIFKLPNDSGEFVEFALGTLDTDVCLKPTSHIYTEFKASWFEISDDLPQFKENANTDKTT
jgi:hypothetical protein